MMKKVLSLFLAVAVLCSCFIGVSAADATGTIDNLDDLANLVNAVSPVKVKGDIEVKTTGDYAESVEASQGESISAKAKIDMTNVINAFKRIKRELTPAAYDGFKDKKVIGEFTITAGWSEGVYLLPADLETGELNGFKFTPQEGNSEDDAKALFKEVSRVKNAAEKTITITIAVNDDLNGDGEKNDGVEVEHLEYLPKEISLEYLGFSILADSTVSGNVTGSTTVEDTGIDIEYSFVDADDTTKAIQPSPLKIKVSSGGDSGSGGSGGSGGSTNKEEEVKYELKYEVNGGTAIASEKHKKDQVVSLSKKVTSKEGYVFDGWYEDARLTKEVTSVTITKNTTIYAKWVKERPPVPEMLNGVDHFAYVIGYPDGTVRPNNNITRAEVTTIFFRLLKDEVRDGNLTDENIFDDVNAEDWHNLAISTMAKLGIVNGRLENMFAPDEFITRAEFTTICARFENLEVGITNSFTDIDEHWAKDDILEAAAYGWIEGYEDKTFRPDEFITRAEAMTLINRVLNRVHKDHGTLLEGMAIWSDNSDETAWYYTAVQEATNSNEYEHINSVYKKWTKLMENRDWSDYQK